MTMRMNNFKVILKAALKALMMMPLAAVVAFGQQQVSLTAAPTTTTMPDGAVVPMWGYTCGALPVGVVSTATCAPLNPNAPVAVQATLATPAVPGWSPVVITVPTGQALTINLTNNLTFQPPTPAGGTAPAANTVPTSIMIVGQVGGGLGSLLQRTTTPSPEHATDSVTWPTVPSAGAFNPPSQGPRVQSFGTEVAAGVTTGLTFGTPAFPLKPGTYLIMSGTHPSIQGPMGLYGILVVTCPPTATAACTATAPAGTAYPGVAATATTAAVPAVTYNAEVPLEFSEIDPVQNKAVQTAVNTAGFSETMVWSGQPGGCGNPSSTNYHQCYPPAVNYTPLYYTINGVSFNKTSPGISLFAALPTGVVPGTGTVLVRMVNAGARMHVPAIVGSQTGTAVAPAVPPTGFSLMAEDGNPLPGRPRVQSDVFMAAGKAFDVIINAPATASTALAVYDRELSLSSNAVGRDSGMLAYIGINGSALPVATGTGVFSPAVARPDTYDSLAPCTSAPCIPLTVSDPSKGVIANDTNVYGVTLLTAPTAGTLTLNANGTFIYLPNAGTASDSFTYCANGSVTGTGAAAVCSSGLTAVASLGAATNLGGITCTAPSFTASMATYLAIKTPGVLLGCKDSAGLPLTVALSTGNAPVATGWTLVPDANGGFTASVPSAGVYNFTFKAQNSLGTLSSTVSASVTFPAASGLVVKVVDGKDKTTPITDYRWIIEEDRTFYIDPNCTTTTTTPPAGCPSQTATNGVSPVLGVNFHTDYMPYVAQGCTGLYSCEGGQTVVDPATGLHNNAVCDVGNGLCRPDLTGNGFTAVDPSQVHLDPSKRYYISVLPGDAANPFYGASAIGHGMGGAQIGAACKPVSPANACTIGTFAPVTVLSQPSPYPTGKYSVMVFEDDFPLNGEIDTGGGTGTVNSANEQGLGGFQIHLWDAMAKFGDFTGQMSYDMFNQPLTNSLAGTIDPISGLDACPVSSYSRQGTIPDPNNPGKFIPDPTQTGKTGMIVTCPTYESDGLTPSPLAGQAVVDNLMPGQWAGIATPGADRIARGEEWLQTNTLDGQKGHDIFTRIDEPSYFQEYGPAGFHNAIGFANPNIINSRKPGVCGGQDPNLPGTGNCTNTLKGKITGERLSRTPDERLYSSGSRDAFNWTQCYVSFGDPDGEDFAFTKCDADGNFTLTGLPDGNWRITTFDEWNDQLVDGLSTPVRLGSATNAGCPGAGSSSSICDVGDIATTQWQINLYTRTFIDDNKDGLSTTDEAGIPFANVAVRLRDGQLYNLLVTDFSGTANFNETFPLFNWYTVETDTTRYKNTGTHVVYDVGGPADGSLSCGVTGYPPCGNSVIGKYLANTAEVVSVPANLRVPGAVYCATADCTGKSIQNGSGTSDPPSVCTTSTTGVTTCSTSLSSGRIDPPWVGVEGWQGFSGQSSFLEFGKEPYSAGENGGIKGHVIYASTRPFDDPQMLVQTQWTPLVPNVTINLYQEGFASDGVTPTLSLVDTTKTSSWDDWAQGFHADGSGNMIPNMSCPGQGAASGPIPDLFYYSLYNQPNYLNWYNSQHAGSALTPLPGNSQFKCYDGMHNWNQLQPAPYDGMYQFPSVTATDPTTGKPTATNCTICSPDHAAPSTDLYYGLPMLPSGKYVVEVVLPPGYELVKEEDKNILIGDNFIAPVTQEFGGLGNIFIIPDQASIAGTFSAGAGYNANNPQNPTVSLGAAPQNGIVPGFIPEPIWPCVGEARIVPDFLSLYPQAHEVSPFAGATRNLCDRKEVTLGDQMGAIAKFFIYTSTHTAAKFTGIITDDFTSEFDPFAPTFGEKFSPPDMPVSFKDWTGAEISRVYSDHWGTYNGMTYSSWEVNPPNPTGYSPTMMVVCMNDPGPIMDTRVGSPTFGEQITDPLFNPAYSQFCYELAFMPGTTAYEDTPVTPTSAFAGAGYNNVDCAYPDATPAISEVDSSDGIGPYVSASGNGHTLTITALGDQMVPNYAYTGPQATTAPYNQKTIKRHYGFGASQRNGTLAAGGVTIGGVNAPVSSWGDTQIVVTVPSGVPPCPVQQQTQYGGSNANCGELVITTGAARVGGNVTGVTISNGGTYTSQPTVTFSAPPGGSGGTTALGTPVLGTGHGVASVTVNSGGVGYTSTPGVTFTSTNGVGSGAAGTATVRREVTSVAVNNTGNYATGSSPSVTFGTSGGGCGGSTTATGTVQSSVSGTPAARHITGVTITNPGSYPSGCTLTVTFSNPGGGTGRVRATGTPQSTLGVTAVAVSTAGTGYTAPPTVGFTGGGATTSATATAVLSTSSSVVSVTITNAGSGYTAAPTVTFSGPAATRATGTATFNGASVVVSGKQSIDTVTVTIGGKAPTHVAATGSIQSAIDAAAPGDMIIVDPTCTTTTGAAAACTTPSTTNLHSVGAHNELLIMWKPVRLQGVGAATSIINANTQPAGKLNPWRQQVNCLFGLGLNGSPINSTNAFDPTGKAVCGSTNGTSWNYFNPYGTSANPFNPQVDRLPLESTVGWIADLNGNLAELLQEPSLMGALEGAGITVLSKGVDFPSNPYDATLLAGFPTGTALLQNTLTNPNGAMCNVNPNPFPSNYSCNPSSIDGLSIVDSSQGGGAIFVHGWGHNLQIANNRINNNAGTLSGGVNVGQGEYPPAYIQGSATNAAPGSCEESPIPNAVLPYCQNVNVNVHNNDISLNMSTGDELFSSTPAGNGGASFCTGADYYKFNYNWLCGNMSSGDGGGFGHIGFSYNGDIEHNSILFNQSLNPTIPTNGGGLVIMGAPDADPICSTINPNLDLDCLPNPASSVGPSDGVGPGLVINANLIMGNAAEAGSGGGIAFQAVNGSDVVSFPSQPAQWNTVTVTNNIIADNVAGWDGGGISLVDSLAVNIINNTIVSNTSTATAGVLFNTIGAPLASQTGSNCTTTSTTSCPQPGGLVALQNGAVLSANIAPLTVTCPSGHFSGTTATNGACKSVSYPKLENNIIWQNSSYYIGVGALSPAFQQNVVTLYNSFTSNAAPNQTTTGACVARSYWDIGVRGDTGPANHSSGVTLTASDSVLTSGGSSVIGSGNSAGNPNLISQYCDGSRTPPEFGASGWQVPPGISDAIVPNPIFNLTPVATVDEGNNWINMQWGPLSMVNPVTNIVIGNYAITTGSSAAGRVTNGGGATNFTDAPAYDFFDTPRKSGSSTDAGAVRVTSAGGSTEFTLSASVVDFSLVPDHSPSTLDQDIQVINTGIAPLTFTNNGTISCTNVAANCNTPSFSIQASPLSTCAGTTIGTGESCVINVIFNPTSTSQAVRNASLTVTSGGVTQTVALSGHDTIATVTVSAITPALTATPANTAAVTGTITVTNTENLCLAAPCPAGSILDAGPYIPTAITLTPLTATGTFALGGTCAVGTPINSGVASVPPVAGGSCTITITYTPPVGATGAGLVGRANLLVRGYGTASTNPIINTNYTAN
jgi:hypothetical protein